MSRTAVFLLAMACVLRAEVRPMTLRQAVETALKQNPDIMLARLDEEKARQAVRVARDPFTPRLIVGSGLAYSNGFPMSIEGSAPSVVQAHVVQDVFNRQQNFAVAQAKEDARGAGLAATSKRDEVVYRTATLYLDAERAARVWEFARRQDESLEKVLEAVQAQVQEGRALPLAEKTAAANLAHARQSAELLADEQAASETALAMVLGFSAEDRVRPVAEPRAAPELPKSEEEAIQSALESNKDLKRMESQIVSKELEVRGEKAQRWPRADLVAQYSLLAKFNNYAEFFSKFQRNNEQFGISFEVPLMAGPGVNAEVAMTQAEISHLKVDLNSARNRIRSDLEQAFRNVKKAGTGAEVARLDLDVAREQLSVDLAQFEEGRVTLRQVEEARVVENDKWIAFYDAQYAVEKAHWGVLRLTGDLLAALEGR
ncbi:MAG TPA: TolC family protein [Bryobacteraceae bacterium]|nr:TolC family protein [Bryobacteraceae bacterium]